MGKRSVYATLSVLLPAVMALAAVSPTGVRASQQIRISAASRWSITLKASATHLRIGQVLTLGVNAPAAAFRGGRRVYLEDLSTRQIMRVCSISTGLNAHSCIAQDQHSVPAHRRYQAFIARTSTAGLTILAHSNVINVTWKSAGAWSVTLKADGKKRLTVALGTNVRLHARSSRALGGEYSLEIRARGCIPGSTTCIRGGILITTCYSGTTCSANVNAPAQGGTKEQYRATILGPKPGGSGTVAKSAWVTVHW